MTSNETFLWLNGRLLSAAEACVSPLDRGFNLGEGAFETLRVYNGRPFAVTRHWNRLHHACEVLGIKAPDHATFTGALESTLKANDALDARVRFTITSGNSQSGISDQTGPTCTVVVSKPTFYPEEEKVTIVPWPRNERSPLAGIKSTSYVDNLLAIKHSKEQGSGEAIFGNTSGHLCEGATSNIFIVNTNGQLATPPLRSGCLPGVTRSLVIEAAMAEGLQVQEEDIPLDNLISAQEAFLTSSTREVQRITHVDGKPISRSPGTYSRRLAELLKKLIQENSDP